LAAKVKRIRRDAYGEYDDERSGGLTTAHGGVGVSYLPLLSP